MNTKHFLLGAMVALIPQLKHGGFPAPCCNYVEEYLWRNKIKSSFYTRTNVALSASEPFALSLSAILENKGIKTSIRSDKSIYKISINRSDVQKFAQYIYRDSTIAMERKLLKFKEIGAV
jgi:hypothetical protein